MCSFKTGAALISQCYISFSLSHNVHNCTLMTLDHVNKSGYEIIGCDTRQK